MTDDDDIADRKLDEAIARILGPDAEDTAPLSRAVLTRIAEVRPPTRPHLAEVLAAPLPMGGLLFSALILAGVAGHVAASGNLTEAMTVFLLFGTGY